MLNEERRREEISGVRPPILTVIETSPLIKIIHLVNICPRRKYFPFLGNFLSHKTIVFLLWKNIFSVQRELQRYLLLSDRFHGSRDTHQCYHLILDNKNKKKDKLTLVKVVNTQHMLILDFKVVQNQGSVITDLEEVSSFSNFNIQSTLIFTFVVIVPSPSLSKRENASRNSEIWEIQQQVRKIFAIIGYNCHWIPQVSH